MKNYFYYKTPIGYITIVEVDNKITDIIFGKVKLSCNYSESDTIKLAYKQIQEYFNKTRTKFDFNILLEGTDFQVKVYKELMNIPYGETRSYQEIAVSVGNVKASRAVGMANNKNRLPIIIPCHRVIGKSKKLVGYAGGVDIKKKLLDLEQNK